MIDPWKVPLSDLDFGEEEEQAVLEVLRSQWLTQGAITREFEIQFASYLKAKHTIAVTNATAALHLACLALEIGPGDEVIVPSLSFVATANAVLYCGARVRFADIISEDELTISPEAIREAISTKTKAIMVMHYGGFPCRMNEILEIARENHLGIIEDAAHAPGAKLNGNYLGTLGDIGCFSFFSNKNLVTGEGGMLVTEQNELAEKIRLLRSHAMTSQTWERYKGHAFSYDVAGLGYNYRIDEIRSAMGLVQLNKLIKNNSLREKHTRFYWKALEEDNVSLPFYNYIMNHNATSAFHIFPILLPADVNRSAIMGYLREKGIQTSIHYPPIHQFSYYKELLPNTVLPTTEEVARHEMTLPLYPSMNRQQSELVVDSLRGALESSETKLTLKQ